MVAKLASQYSIDQHDFTKFLKLLRAQVPGNGKVHCVVDNLTVHRTNKVQKAADKLKIELVFNAPYSSEYNPIERCWSYGKRIFATDCLSITDFKNKPLMTQRVLRSLETVDSTSIARHVRRCMYDMRDWLDYN